MKNIKQEILNQMIRTLEKLEVKYHLVYEDTVLTNIEQDKKHTRRKSLYPRNELRDFINKQLPEDLNSMSAGFVDCEKYNGETIRSSLSSYLCAKFGKKSFHTSVDKNHNCVWFWSETSPFDTRETKTLDQLQQVFGDMQ